jgi:hypothetical protein
VLRARVLSTAAVCGVAWVVITNTATATADQDRRPVRRISWTDAAPFHVPLTARGITADEFPSYVERVRQSNLRRVREGDLDHLVFYLLQSTRFTSLPPIEPALSAKALVDGLGPEQRAEFLRSSQLELSRIPAPVRSRAAALLRAIDSPASDPRLAYFRNLVNATYPDRRERNAGLLREYVRAMRFVYEKEFVAQRSAQAADAIAELYRTRGLSTDTAVESGYVVYLGLGVLQSLRPDRRIRRVLVVGPGLDLAPRTGLLEDGPPESYQPWAVIDALLSLGLARADDLAVVGADINPRVVEHLRDSHRTPPVLTLVSGIAESETVKLRQEYRDYFERLGRSIGDEAPERRRTASTAGHLEKTVRVGSAAAHVLTAEPVDIVTERLDGQAFDLIIATNILPYFDDAELMLAMSNIAGMLAPDGALVHNEARPALRDMTAALGIPIVQSRHAVIADVRGAAAPLFDSVWVHVKNSR